MLQLVNHVRGILNLSIYRPGHASACTNVKSLPTKGIIYMKNTLCPQHYASFIL